MSKPVWKLEVFVCYISPPIDGTEYAKQSFAYDFKWKTGFWGLDPREVLS